MTDHTLRTLPTTIRTVAGETPASVLRRTAHANALTETQLWGHLRTLNPDLPVPRDPEAATGALEALAGLRRGWFADQRTRNAVPRRCPHNQWTLTVCTRCSKQPPEKTGCARCSAGEPTTVQIRTGAVCLKHHRYTLHGLHIDLPPGSHHLMAERLFRQHLAPRGITTGSGELQTAAHILHDAITIPHTAPTAATPAEEFYAHYPLIIRLTEILTDPGFVSYLLSPTWGPHDQAALLAAAVDGVIGAAPADHFTERIHTAIAHGRRAVTAAYGMVGRGRTSRACTLERALASAAHTHRACLLRHLDAVRLPNIPAPGNKRRAPATAIIAQADHLPDDHSLTHGRQRPLRSDP